ncbi:HAD family hydrolase [Paenibacillus aestuarii]|uniref:HAD family hydrolase n=1 Tax=Paenibacillus aestuarii TaxID=516965 RepID=A0ABW0K9E3_9BACL|nr:HAD family hydrolase [Paenibacillus aestuarii]
MLKAVLFDMDGVIIDSEPLHFRSDQLLMKTFGIEMSVADLEVYVGMRDPDMLTQIILKYGLKTSLPELLSMQLNHKISLLREKDAFAIDGIVDLIQSISDHHIQIGLASSSSRAFIEAVLDKLGIASNFDCIISGYEVEKGKPDPDIFLKAASLLGVSPEHCLVIEDSGHGVKAAKAAGMKCIGFQNPNSGNQDLSNADMIVRSIRDIHVKDWM